MVLAFYIAGSVIYLFVLSILAARDQDKDDKEMYGMIAAIGFLVWPIMLVGMVGHYAFKHTGPWVLAQIDKHREKKALQRKTSQEDKLMMQASLPTKDYRSLASK